jgi:uncharacterized protein
MKKKLAIIIKKIEDMKPELISRFHISQLSLFGSFVRGEETPQSDLDVLVSFSIMPSLFEFVDLQIYLSESLNIKVDLVIQEDLKPFISKNILTEKINLL